MTDLTPAKITAIRRYTDPRMHIWGDVFVAAMGVWWFVMALLAAFGIIRPFSKFSVCIVTATLMLLWFQDLIDKFVSERTRVRKVRAIEKQIGDAQ